VHSLLVQILIHIIFSTTQYEKLLEMVQRQSQLAEVRWSRLQTELASAQNLSVMIFTTFTVIFLPLTFFTGLFGMNTKEWGGGDFLSLELIGEVSLPVSFVLIAGSLIAAFSGHVQRTIKLGYRYGEGVAKVGKKKASFLVPEAARKEKVKRSALKAQREIKRTWMKEKSYDFWDTVKRERNSIYRIPGLNRKKTSGG
jgi:hypothetical protein